MGRAFQSVADKAVADRLPHDHQTIGYLRWAAPCYAFLGLGMCLYFASQGSGKLLGPVLAGTLRLLVVAGGGCWLLQVGAPASTMFALIGAGLVSYGLATALAVKLTRWGRPPG